MPVGVSLSELLDQLKYESGQSPNVAHGVAQRDALVHLLRRTQEELWTQHLWPHLAVRTIVDLVAGDSRYAYPANLTFEGVTDVRVAYGTDWCPVDYGITDEHLSVYDTDLGARSSPVTRWQHAGDVAENNLFEVWPCPDVPQTLRFRGQRPLAPLVNDADLCALDSTLIVLYAAAEILADRKSEVAPLKLQKAQAHLRVLKARQGANKQRPFAIGGNEDGRRPRPGIDYIPMGT